MIIAFREIRNDLSLWPRDGFIGGVAERSNATDCKSVDLVYDGSNPSPSTTDESLGVFDFNIKLKRV